ncbi:MAG TPA: hypothetical protein VFE14_16865 [Micromonosporaceae bacterium]|nr:hypothetical protein [Micromonosporaceae bacterium]
MLGIEGYEPQWHHDGRTLAAAHRSRFTRLLGQPLIGSWLMWDPDERAWFADGPVILGFPEHNVEITHRKFDECAITWNQVDMSMPLDWPGLNLDWRAGLHPSLGRVQGRPLRGVNVIERIMPAHWRPSVLHAIELLFEGARLAIYNALDENGINDDPDVDLPVGRWRRVTIA